MDDKLHRATVSRGRTVVAPDETKKVVAGYDTDGKPIRRPVLREFGPGLEVSLPPSEIKELRAGGYLVDPSNEPPPVEEGAKVIERA